MRSSVNSDKFTKFSKAQQKLKDINDQDELIRMKLGMTLDEFKVYKKKKNAINMKRDAQEENLKKKVMEQKKAVLKVIDEFEKMDDINSQAKYSAININMNDNDEQ